MNIKRIILTAVVIICITASYAQTDDIAITSFEPTNSLTASVSGIKDKAGNACAAIRFSVKDNHVKIEPNVGVLKTVRHPGEIILYVPAKETKKLTLRIEGAQRYDYIIPMEIESSTTYDAVIYLSESLLKRRKANSGHVVYASAGYNIVSISGPSLAVGIDINRHNVEMGVIFGLNKSDDIYHYNGAGDLQEGYNYKAFRAYLRYGYDFHLSDFFTLTPQTGVTLNSINGSALSGINNVSSKMKSSTTMSALVALRLTLRLNDHLGIHLTPEYNFGVVKDDNFKTISRTDNTIKSWTDGFSLNASLSVFF